MKLGRALAGGSVVLLLPLLQVSMRSGTDAQSRQFDVKDGEAYALTAFVAKPERFTKGRVTVEVRDAAGILAEKTLHPFDLDLSINLRPHGAVTVSCTGAGADLISIELAPLRLSGKAAIALLPNRTWENAQEIEPGQTVYGSGDDRAYVPASADRAYADLVAGFQWFKFTLRGDQPKLAHFLLETPDRDVPPDLDVFEPADGGVVPYREGASAYNPEATQNYPGLSPFRTRILHPGKTYYLRVAANHPEYTLRTSLYDAAPYRDPKQAVIAGMDYLIALGDAWHANTPRRGAIALRSTMPHAEPSACIACHPTQFTVRGYLTAVGNGYPNHHPAQLQFLTERLANNPRPLYGQAGADWARVIFSARTVASRVPVLLDQAGLHLPEVTRGFADYLKLTALSDEADGSQPMVSAFEIGLQSWQTYGLMVRDHPTETEWAGRRDAVRDEVIARKPANVIDLAWKIAALAKMGRSREEVEPLIEQLYTWQNAAGQFPYPFDHAAAGADFITYQAMYALALAGHRPESDPRLARTAAYALAKQRVDGSWQGDPIYKGFDTPFRDTQFAVMALSELYPHPRLDAPAAVCGNRESLDGLLAGIDAGCWTNDLRSILKGSAWPLARSAAAAHIEDVAALADALGDSSKIVQRSAAARLRRIALSRADSVAPALIAALDSDSGRTRWGALRVMAQEFRSLSENSALLAAVEKTLAADPMPQNRFQAANALWRWDQWQRGSGALDSLARAMGSEADASVRRGLIESVYNVLDENAGQMEAWERAMISPADQKKTEQAFHHSVAEQAAVIARHLDSGNRQLRLGLLTSLWDFHLRHMAIPEDNRDKVDVILPSFFADYSAGVPRLHDAEFSYEPYRETAAFAYRAGNGFQVVRLGNDTDLPHLFADSGEALEQALLKCLDGADREMTIEVVKAGSILGDAETTAFTSAMLKLLQSPDAEVRAAVRYVYANHQRGRLTLGSPDTPDASLRTQLTQLIDARQADPLAVALPLIAELPVGSTFTRDQDLSWSVEKLLRDDHPSAAALRAAAVFPGIADAPLMRSEILAALGSADYGTQQSAIDLVLARYVTDPTTDELSRQFIAAMQGRARSVFLDKLDPEKFALRLSAASSYRAISGEPLPADDNLFSSRVVVESVAESLNDPEALVREAGADLVRSQPKLQEALSQSPAPTHRTAPDFEYFTAKIQPILAARGADGKACVICHASHAIFKLRIPAGSFTPEQSRENYLNALKVVNTGEPRKSLLLIKPTRPNDAVGDANLYLATHNGGERWTGDEASAEYETILEWIRGAKLKTSK